MSYDRIDDTSVTTLGATRLIKKTVITLKAAEDVPNRTEYPGETRQR